MFEEFGCKVRRSLCVGEVWKSLEFEVRGWELYEFNGCFIGNMEDRSGILIFGYSVLESI